MLSKTCTAHPSEDSNFYNADSRVLEILAGIWSIGPAPGSCIAPRHESRARYRRHLQLLHAAVRTLSVHGAVHAVSERTRVRAETSGRDVAGPGPGLVRGDISSA